MPPTQVATNSLRSSARTALVALTAINLLNYLDRYLVAGVVEPLKSEFAVSDADIGLLTSAFLVVYMVASPLLGLVARRGRRTLLLGLGVLVWSVATIGSGLVGTFAQLLVARAIVGIGEAAYSTVGPALLADHYPPVRRPVALCIFYSAIPVGSALSYIVAGWIGGEWGWRAVFYAGGLPGIVLGLACLALRDPPRGQFDAPTPEAIASSRQMSEGIAALARNTTYLLATAGYAAFTFAFGALAVWMPNYLEKVRGWSHAESTTTFGIVLVVSGFAGTLGGGVLARRLGSGTRSSFILCAVCLMLAVPGTLVALYATSAWAILLGLAIASTFSFATQGPVNSVIVNAVDAQTRPFAVGASVLCIHLLGDVPSPWLVGVISDAGHGMTLAMGLVPIAMGVAAAIWFIGGARR